MALPPDLGHSGPERGSTMRNPLLFAALLGTALGLCGCRTVDKAPGCEGKYVPVNGTEHYRQGDGA